MFSLPQIERPRLSAWERWAMKDSASTGSALTRMEMRTTNRLASTSRASRVSRMIPTVLRSRSTGSATVTSSRLSLVRRI